MLHPLRLSHFLASLLLCAATAHSQTAMPPPAHTAPGTALTAEQLATVKRVLAKYRPASLTTEDAKILKRSLRDAGVPRSHALDMAMRDAGFSVERLDVLDPPPPPAAGPPPASP